MSLKRVYNSIDLAIEQNSSEIFFSNDIGTSAYILQKIITEPKKEAYFWGETISNLFYSHRQKDILYFLNKINCPIKIRTRENDQNFKEWITNNSKIDYKYIKNPLFTNWKSLIFIDDKTIYIDKGFIGKDKKFHMDAIFCSNLQEEIKNKEELEKLGFFNLNLLKIHEFKERLEKIV